jgi:hypothetical protein
MQTTEDDIVHPAIEHARRARDFLGWFEAIAINAEGLPEDIDGALAALDEARAELGTAWTALAHRQH